MYLKHLYAPWRSDYTQDTVRKEKKSDECVFCTQLAANNDDAHFIVKRYDHCAVWLNKYPYNAGHLLVIPYAHKPHLTDLTLDQRNEIMEVISQCTAALKGALNAEGCNIGFNLGKAAGAGIPDHMHAHVLPRWHGDTNFMPTLTGTKQISVDLHKTFAQIKDALAG